MKNRIQELEKKILHHKELYYRGKVEISDEAYDKIEAELKSLDPQNPILKLIGHMQIETDFKVAHQKKMLSLEKTYSESDLIKWVGSEEVVSVYKIDGSSCSLIYKDGHLQLAKTRGDGQFGENITKKAMFIADIPKSIPDSGEQEIRGEIFCYEDNFFHLCEEMEKLGLEKPTSQRNIVAGLLGRKESIHLASYLSFKAFDVIDDKKYQKEKEKLLQLKKLGFELPEYEIHSNEKSILKRIQEAKEFMSKGDYLVDGMVFVYDALNLHLELGETSHHPRYKMAFKFAGDTKSTKIKEIEWGVSRNGVLTPVAAVEPVELSGAMISKVTLHNFGLVRNYELKTGDEIEIIRSGEVIPKFLGITKKSDGKFSFPENCPSCHSKLIIQDIWLLCQNEICPAKVKEEILNYIQKSGIDDLSDKRLEEMITKGIVGNIPDLYKVESDHFLMLDKVKEKLATKMFENIQKSKKQSLAKFINAIGVEGVSLTKSEKIISQGYNTIEKILSLNMEQMLNIDGFAKKSSEAFLSSIEKKKPLIKELLRLGVKIEADEINTGEGPLTQMKFCITGELSMNRTEFEKIIKKNGGVMVSSVSKNTNFLITNETDSSSSKFVKAKALGVAIISEEKLLEMIKEEYGQG
jgi:DNA ligase (NAD+)